MPGPTEIDIGAIYILVPVTDTECTRTYSSIPMLLSLNSELRWGIETNDSLHEYGDNNCDCTTVPAFG